MADEDTDKVQTEEVVEESANEKPLEETQDEAAQEESATEDSVEEEVASPASEESFDSTQDQGPAKDEPRPEAEKKAVKPVSASLEKIIEQIEKLSVLELADLVHALEDRFGVTAAAPMAVAGGPVAASGDAAEAGEEKSTFDVILASAGANKIGAIKAVRELVPTLGLKEAKDLVEAAPKPVLEGVSKEAAEEAKAKLTAAGATVELK